MKHRYIAATHWSTLIGSGQEILGKAIAAETAYVASVDQNVPGGTNMLCLDSQRLNIKGRERAVLHLDHI